MGEQKNVEPPKPYLTTADVVALLGVSSKTVANMVRDGRLQVRERWGGGRYRPFIFDPDENPLLAEKLQGET